MKRFFPLFLFLTSLFGGFAQSAFAKEPILTSGPFSNLYIGADGSAWVWGRNNEGQLADGTSVGKNQPIKVKSLENIKAVRLYGHGIALKTDGTVWTWGANLWGELGYGKYGPGVFQSVPHMVEGLNNVTAISVGANLSLAIKKDGTVWAWGKNNHGQIGNGRIANSEPPSQVRELKDVVKIEGGKGFVLALKSDGTVWAWGKNNRGQLGNNDTSDSSIPLQVKIGEKIKDIFAGDSHSMALSVSNTIWTWGSNFHGELGNGTLLNSLNPAKVEGLTDENTGAGKTIVGISGGKNHSMCLYSDGTVWAWGSNRYGELGNGTTVDAKFPIQVKALSNVVQMDIASYHSIALKSDGTVWAWGQNVYGQIGDGSTNVVTIPHQVHFPK